MTGLAARAPCVRTGAVRTVRLAAGLAILYLGASPALVMAQRPQASPPAPSAAAPAASFVTLPPNYDAAGPFYSGTSLHDIQITMKPDDWETLKANYASDTYYPAALRGGTSRSRQSGSGPAASGAGARPSPVSASTSTATSASRNSSSSVR